MNELINSIRNETYHAIKTCTQQAIIKLQEPKPQFIAKSGIVAWLVRILFYGAGLLLAIGLPTIVLILAAAAIDTYITYHLHKNTKTLQETHYYEKQFNRIIAGLQ